MPRQREGEAEALASLQAAVHAQGLYAFEKGTSSPNGTCTVVVSGCLKSNIVIASSVLMMHSD